jgi:hypothetical protein
MQDENIGMDLKKIGWNGMDLFLVAHNRAEFLVVVNTVKDFGFYIMREIA